MTLDLVVYRQHEARCTQIGVRLDLLWIARRHELVDRTATIDAGRVNISLFVMAGRVMMTFTGGDIQCTYLGAEDAGTIGPVVFGHRFGLHSYEGPLPVALNLVEIALETAFDAPLTSPAPVTLDVLAGRG